MPNQIPGTLRLVALIFILSGIAAGLDVLVTSFHHEFMLGFVVAGFFIGFGLLDYKPIWRLTALGFLWFVMVMAPVLCVLAVADPHKLELKLFEESIVGISAPAFLSFMIWVLLFAFWQYRVLTRPDVRKLFYQRTEG